MIEGTVTRGRWRRRGRRFFRWTALAVLLCIVPSVLPELLSHTDDGCEVEVHCVACRVAYSSRSVFADAPAVPLPYESVEGVRSHPVIGLSEVRVDVPASRGPPAGC